MLKILIVSFDPNYAGLARLPKALQSGGFEVAALCLEEAFLAKTRYLNQFFPLVKTKHASSLIKQLVSVVQVWQPAMVIYGDETTVSFAHYIVQNARQFSSILPAEVLKLLTFSLGDPKFFSATLRKHETLEIAAQLRLKVPAMRRVDTVEQAMQFAELHGYPVVVKKDFSWSGLGVKVCSEASELRSVVQDFLPHPQSVFKSWAKQALQQNWFPVAQVLSLQQYIGGRTAMHPVVALNGEVLAGVAAVKEVTCSATGPSSVIRFINHAGMQKTVVELVKYFRFSGFASFDFIVEDGTHEAYLVECNPRPVPICHLGERVGIDLCQALYQGLWGHSTQPQLQIQAEQVVALFPQEWKRDPESVYLHQAYHDVPWDDPSLMKSLTTNR